MSIKDYFQNHIKSYHLFQGISILNVSPQLFQQNYNAQIKNGLSPNAITSTHVLKTDI